MKNNLSSSFLNNNTNNLSAFLLALGGIQFFETLLPLVVFLYPVVGVNAALQAIEAIVETHAVNLADKVVPALHFAVGNAEPEIFQNVW